MLLSSPKFRQRGRVLNFPIHITSEISTLNMTPVLCLNCDLENNTPFCKICSLELEQIVLLKQALVSLAKKVFDPLGFTTPVSSLPKLILEECWKLKLKRDELIPKNFGKQFLRWVQEIKLISGVKLQHWIDVDNYENNDASLHMFCDGNEHSCATCIF